MFFVDGKIGGEWENYTKPINYSLIIMRGPVLTYDVWEYANYLDYQNCRAAHLEALWKIVDWKVVDGRYNSCRLKNNLHSIVLNDSEIIKT